MVQEVSAKRYTMTPFLCGVFCWADSCANSSMADGWNCAYPEYEHPLCCGEWFVVGRVAGIPL